MRGKPLTQRINDFNLIVNINLRERKKENAYIIYYFKSCGNCILHFCNHLDCKGVEEIHTNEQKDEKMSNFEITHETTLYELQEFFKRKVGCHECELSAAEIASCIFNEDTPSCWAISKPKTYKEDFLEKFPNSVLALEIYGELCVKYIYALKIDCAGSNCKKCWTMVMEGENE